MLSAYYYKLITYVRKKVKSHQAARNLAVTF